MKTRRVLMIAMSGIRVRSDALREAGMTLPGFVERSKVIASLPSLSLLTLAAHCPPHWEPVYREYDELPADAASAIEREGFDLVAISSFTARIGDAYALADALRKRGIAVVLGGLHVSALPEEAARHADSVVRGEGEAVWPRLLADAERGKLRRRYSSFAGGGRGFRFENARVPRYDLLDSRRYNRIPLQTARGCPRHCEFCAASRTISRYKLKPIRPVERELEAVLARWPKPFIELADDNTFVDKRWGKSLLRMLARYPLKWFTETDVSIAEDEELLRLLAEAGCAQLLIGFESPNESSLAGIDAVDWKRRRAKRYREAIRTIQSFGISVNGCFILGLDSDGVEAFDATGEFIESSGLAEAQITLLTPFPGTRLFERLRREGRLPREEFWDDCTLFDVTFQPSRMSADELERGFRKLMRTLYSKDAVSRRKAAFRRCRRSKREAHR